MIYREAGEFKISYKQDQETFTIRFDKLAFWFMVAIFALPIILGNGIQDGASATYLTSPEPLSYATGFFARFIAVLLNTGIYGLELIVSLVQAYVFTLLSCVFIGMAIHADH